MALPRHSEELCFSTDVLLGRNFKVDDFVSQCRQQVTIERLREDLDSYFRTLKNAMVELINKDYADFVNLSANLVDMDKSITNLLDPLGKLQEEIMAVKQAMEESIDLTENRLEAWTNIREQKAVLHRVISILESVQKLERLLKITSPSDTKVNSVDFVKFSEREKFSSMVMERVASEFNKLQYNVSLTDDHPVVQETNSRIAVITSTLQSHLESSFKVGLESKDRDTLTQCMQTYASINRQTAAEDMFRGVSVYPYMDKVISAKALITHPQGLAGLYVEVLQFVPKHCSLLLEITSTGHGVSGYDFVVSAVWPTIVTVLEEKASVIFAPGNPDTFHRNYCASMDFLSSFEQQCPSQHSVKRLRTHPSFTSFMSKWSLPVYFQIRFQEIAGSLENSLSLPLKVLPSNKEDTPTDSSSANFRLELFQTLWEAIQKCWDESVYIAALVHRFWKLTLQLIMRLALWLDGLSVTAATEVTSETSGSADKSVPLDVCLCIFNDCEELIRKIPSIVDIVKVSQNAALLRNEQILKDGLCEAATEVEKLLPKYADIITDRVAKQCIQNLEPAHTIPRLFRRTNREAPCKPSSYVNNITKPLLGVSPNFPAGRRKEWMGRIVCSVSERYFSITSELLTSVKRTEDSLLKLKSYRKSLVPTSSGGLSDDNKIRLQLALDIEQYASQVATVQLEMLELPIIQQLLETGLSAKTASSISLN